MKDRITGCEKIISIEHYLVHDQQMFSASQYFTIAAAGTQDVMFVVGSTPAHMIVGLNLSGQGLVQLWEGITNSVNGTSITVNNMDRDAVNSCLSVVFYTPTWSTNSEKLILSDLIPGGNQPTTRVGAQGRPGTEWILKPSTKYLYRITNQAGATITATFNAQWYELDED